MPAEPACISGPGSNLAVYALKISRCGIGIVGVQGERPFDNFDDNGPIAGGGSFLGLVKKPVDLSLNPVTHHSAADNTGSRTTPQNPAGRAC